MNFNLDLNSLGLGGIIGSIITILFPHILQNWKESRTASKQEKEGIGKFILNLIYLKPERITEEQNITEVLKISSRLKKSNKKLAWALRMFVFETIGAYSESEEESEYAMPRWEKNRNYLETEANKMLGDIK